LDAVADDAAATMRAGRRHRVDRALEAVEHMGLAAAYHFERLVVVVAANFTGRHDSLLATAAPGCPGCQTLHASWHAPRTPAVGQGRASASDTARGSLPSGYGLYLANAVPLKARDGTGGTSVHL